MVAREDPTLTVTLTLTLPPTPTPTPNQVAHEGVPACLLLGHADGSICSVQLPGGAPPETMLGQHGAPVTALLALRSTPISPYLSPYLPIYPHISR